MIGDTVRDAKYTDDWHGCYDGSWKGVIVDEAFAHPAKYAYGLIRRIIQHGMERGWWHPGDVIGDPFGGIGTGGIIASAVGLSWIGVELEPRFVDLAKQNFAKTVRAPSDPVPLIIQGDSREFAKLVGEVAGVVCSPPYAETRLDGGATTDGAYGYRADCQYGASEGQIGAMKPGELSAVVTSPPYAESIKGEHGETETAAESRNKRNTPGGSLGQSQRHGGYGGKGNIGNLKSGTLDGCVSSPPWAHTTSGHDEEFDKVRSGGPVAKEYGDTKGQIANDSPDTYWQAVAAVYQQVHQALKPGGVFVLVVKSYVKNKRRVPLPDQTAELLDRLGFEPVERIRAWLVKEETHAGLFGDVTVKKERKSFFRRLAEKKGSPPIDWEEVICVMKPLDTPTGG